MAKKELIKVIIAAAIILAIFFPPFAKYMEIRSKSRGLDLRIKTLQKKITMLEEKKARLETDITYIEKKAREKIGVVRKGEIILKEAPQNKK